MVYPMKCAYGFGVFIVSRLYHQPLETCMINLPIVFMFASLALCQICDWCTALDTEG